MRERIADPRQCSDRGFDALGDVVGLLQGAVGGELEVQRDADLIAVLEDRDVVRLADGRLAERDRQDAVAEREPAATGLDVDDDVAVGQRVLDGLLDLVGGGVAFDDRSAGWDRHDHVGEIASGRFAQPQPLQLDLRAESDDRFPRDRLSARGGGVHQHLGVLQDQPARRREDDHRHDQRGDRVAVGKAGTDEDQTDEHSDRAGHVTGEMKRVRPQRRRVIPPRAPAQEHRPADVDHDRDADDREHVPLGVQRLAAATRRLIASIVTNRPPPTRIVASASADRFSARRWP